MNDYEKQVVHTLGGDAVEPGRYMFFCPGCQCGHWFQIGQGPGPRWTFDGNMERPTVNPSILVRGPRMLTDEEVERVHRGENVQVPDEVCHSYVRDGQIQFLSDCTHKLAGQTVALEPF